MRESVFPPIDVVSARDGQRAQLFAIDVQDQKASLRRATRNAHGVLTGEQVWSEPLSDILRTSDDALNRTRRAVAELRRALDAFDLPTETSTR